jgi:protein-tyrosine phosphatase
VLTLDQSVLALVARLVPPEALVRVTSLMAFAPETGVTDVADPWAGTAADYAHAFSLIRAGVDGLVASLRTG